MNKNNDEELIYKPWIKIDDDEITIKSCIEPSPNWEWIKSTNIWKPKKENEQWQARSKLLACYVECESWYSWNNTEKNVKNEILV